MDLNKSDKILFLIIIIVFIISLYIIFSHDSSGSNALVYKNGEVILEIDLNLDEQLYEVEGENGTVRILAGNGKVKVIEEKSPYHICSKQGYITKSYETIVCLPNKISIEISNNKKSQVDTVVK
jgi:Uncharacterized protein conserved in bacteria